MSESDDPAEDRVRRTNQHKGCPPDSIIRPWVEYYVGMNLSNPRIVEMLIKLKRFETDTYSFSVPSLKRRRKEWKMPSTRGFKWTPESIGPHVELVRVEHPQRGASDMKATLLRQYGIHVAKQTILDYQRFHHPEEVAARRRNYMIRKVFYAAGVNDIHVDDQHDKFKRFNLWMHVGLDPFAGYVLWLKIWWTNRNPRLICSYHLDSIIQNGGMPLVTQSDLGTENYGIANVQTVLRQALDPTLAGTLQHRWQGKHRNVKPEIFWSQLRRREIPGLEDLLDLGVNSGIYDPNDTIETLVFHWVFIPFLQKELDKFVDQYNATPKRADRNSILPRGPPRLIFESPSMFKALDFKVAVPTQLVEEVRTRFAPPDHPVFHLVPPSIAYRLDALYRDMEPTRPPITRSNCWDIFSLLLEKFKAQQLDPSPETIAINSAIQDVSNRPPVGEDPDDKIEIIPGQKPLRMGGVVIGPDGLQHNRVYVAGTQSLQTDSDNAIPTSTVDEDGAVYGVWSDESGSDFD